METIGEAEKSDRIVVLDAGHGGTDSGKVGINGVKEKDINLTITNSVKKILEKENIQVIMTRETDEQLAQSKVEDLKYRVKIMNEVSPVLAVSIHQNSYHQPDFSLQKNDLPSHILSICNEKPFFNLSFI